MPALPPTSGLRRAALTTFALAAVAAHAGAQQGYNATVESTPGLLAYYTFTQSAQANSVVNGYTGTLQNGATVGGPGSGPNISDPSSSALLLNNGATGQKYATAGGSNPLLGGIGNSGSIVAWINLASLPSAQGRAFSIAGESNGGNDFDLQINPADNLLHFYTEAGGNTTSYTPFGSSDLNRWVFVAATFATGVDRYVYIDGALAGGVGDTPGPHGTNSAPFYIGQSNVFGGRYFDGAIADVAVFNTDLTAAQISTIYASRLVPAGSGGVTTAPEPSTWALTAAGVGALGTLARRRARA